MKLVHKKVIYKSYKPIHIIIQNINETQLLDFISFFKAGIEVVNVIVDFKAFNHLTKFIFYIIKCVQIYLYLYFVICTNFVVTSIIYTLRHNFSHFVF